MTDWQTQPEGPEPASADAPPAEHPHDRLSRWAKLPNIATELTDETLGPIGMRVRREWEIDEQSRSDWRTKVEKALKLAMQDAPPKNYPWPRSSNIVYPLMTTAAMQFAARAYPAIIHDKEVVKGTIQGRDDGILAQGPDGQPVVDPQTQQPVFATPPGALQARADRIGDHMSWQLLDEMPEWEPETDRLLHQLPIVGSVFRKTYFDPARGRNMSLMVPALKLTLPYFAKSLELSPRATEEVEFYPYQIREMERAGLFLERRYTATPDASLDEDAPIVFLEQHRWLDLDGDNYPEPYVVTVDKEGQQVVRIVARFDTDGVHVNATDDKIARIEPVQVYTQYDFLPSLDGGIYGTGFGQLLGPINDAVNTTLNMLVDAGHLANTNGGFIAKGLSMNTGTLRWTMGEFKPVNVGGGLLRDSVLPLPFSGPSQVLFTLLGTLIDAGKDVASIKDVLAGEQPQANVPATTVLALIEQGQKVFTAIYKRVHRGLKAELQKLYRLNRIYLPEMKEFRIGDVWKAVTRQDYAAGAGVEPISDPEMVSDMQQLGRAQYMMQFRGDPLIVQPELYKRLLKAARIDKIEVLLNSNPTPPPAIAMKGLELEIKGRDAAARERLAEAQALEAIGQAILNLAKADATVGDQHIAWLSQQLQGIESAFEMNQRVRESQQQGAGDGPEGSGGGAPAGAGPVGGGVPNVAPPPGLEGHPALPGAVPAGLPGATASGMANRLSQVSG